MIDTAIKNVFETVSLSDEEVNILISQTEHIIEKDLLKHKEITQSINLQIGQLKQKLERATEALLDGILSKETISSSRTKNSH